MFVNTFSAIYPYQLSVKFRNSPTGYYSARKYLIVYCMYLKNASRNIILPEIKMQYETYYISMTCTWHWRPPPTPVLLFNIFKRRLWIGGGGALPKYSIRNKKKHTHLYIYLTGVFDLLTCIYLLLKRLVYVLCQTIIYVHFVSRKQPKESRFRYSPSRRVLHVSTHMLVSWAYIGLCLMVACTHDH